MKEKASFNSNKNGQNKLNIKLILIILVCIILIYILALGIIKTVKSLPESTPQVKKAYYNVSEFGSLEEIFKNFGCNLISKDETNGILKAYVSFNLDLYTDNISNEKYFVNICRVVAEFQKFKDFELIDSSKNINIAVKCEGTNIVELKINGDNNYYLNHDSEINSQKELVSVTKFAIQSRELQSLIDSNWDESKVNWGSQDSSCNGYNIYFDEGIKYKVVSRSVFNVIYTNKYLGQVAEGLNANSSKEDVKFILGEPTFNNNDLLYGYKGESNYLFFDFVNQEVSVYPVVNIGESEIQRLEKLINDMNSSSDVKSFASKLTELWIDYDIYDYDSNYVDLKYTLKGVELNISSSSLKNGIYIYQNYSGNKDIKNLDNVYIMNSDLIFDEEVARASKAQMNINDDGDYTDEDTKYLGTNFSIRFQGKLGNNENGKKGPMFFSRDKSYPDSELSKTLVISSYIWYDDYNFIYSVDDDGIYVYNCANRENNKLVDVSGIIIINSIQNNKIIYNETEELLVN